MNHLVTNSRLSPPVAAECIVLALASPATFVRTGVVAELVVVQAVSAAGVCSLHSHDGLTVVLDAVTGQPKLDDGDYARSERQSMPQETLERLTTAWLTGYDVEIWDEHGVPLLLGSPVPMAGGLAHWVRHYREAAELRVMATDR